MESDEKISAAKQCMAAAHRAADSGSLAEAVERVDEALRLRPDFAPYWVSLGSFLRRQAAFQDSEDAIRKTIDINPSASYAWTELGLLFKDRELFEEAADCLNRVLRESISLHGGRTA